MQKGWVSIHRSLRDHYLWGGESFTKGQAWVDLILYANHKPAKVRIKDSFIDISRGQQARSMVTLAKDWGWSRGKVRRFLKLLENDGMIVQQTNQLTTIITICNYEVLQSNDLNKRQVDSTADGQQTDSGRDTNNNDNNEKNDYSPDMVILDEDFKCVEYLEKALRVTDPNFRYNDAEAEAKEVMLIREGGRGHREICEVFNYANGSDYWKDKIIRVSTLREHFGVLAVQRAKAIEKTSPVKLPVIDFAMLEWIKENKKKYKLPDQNEGEQLKAYRGRVQNHLNNLAGVL